MSDENEYKPYASIVLEESYLTKRSLIHSLEAPNEEARFAMAMVERWGMVAAESNGEDSAGRASLRLQTPEELISRAFKVAELVFAEARNRGWVIHLPVPVMIDPLMDDEDREARREARRAKRATDKAASELADKPTEE